MTGACRTCHTLPSVTVDRFDPTPIYLQIAGVLRERIKSGRYAPGQVLPSEQHLQQEFEVARATARRAVEVLRDEGLIVTMPQRGSYVTPK
ncbi:GntR family transcriptional regulator [Spongiactinospora rosea]|uniref:GntR family transcriptional regulator n=1 Tax=Spongiactinospora rosea TaxID=2248750 RepID=A0A366LVE1_9ACTN|nr:GntR family transcriptional regulator [Spongiactinospora rosea]